MMLFNLYKLSSAVVSWNGFLSKPYKIYAGVRQGGSMSPVIFTVYVNSVIEMLLKSDLGCYIGRTYLGVIMYADDLLLISGSVSNLQKMIDVCLNEFRQLDLQINATKSMCIRIGQCHNEACDMMSVHGALIPWSNCFRYLGVTVSSGNKFGVECKPIRAKFYRSFNALYSKISRANECVIISLVKQFCIPIVMYSLEAICLNSSTLNSLDNILYNAFGKIFKTYDHSVLSYCMYYLNCLPIKHLYNERRAKFLSKIANHANPIVKSCFNISGELELRGTEVMFHVERNKTHMLHTNIWKTFESSIGINCV